MAYTKEEQSEQTFAKEALPETGALKGEMGIGVFGSAVFGGLKGRQWNKEAQSSQDYSKEELSDP